MADLTTDNMTLECENMNGSLMTVSSSVALINGYFTPPVVLFTVVTNILVCVVLLKPHMRNPTNTMLVSMALSDMFTGLVALPPYFVFYTMGRYVEYLPYDWCYIYECLTEYLPTLFHTASIWLTVALALQRYMCICHSTLANRWSTIPNVIVATGIIYVAATASQICRFFDSDYIPMSVPSHVDGRHLVDTCCVRRAAFIRDWLDAYFNIYYWFRIVFIHLIPCSSLVALNAILIIVMRTAQARRRQLLMQNRKTESRRLKDSNCTTFMLVVVVAVFLVVEFPLGIIITLYVIGNTFQVETLINAFEVPSMYINFLIILSYPLNFFIYCVMSRQFRETFKRLFVPGSSRPVTSMQSHYQTIATENGLVGKSAVTADTRIRQSESSL